MSRLTAWAVYANIFLVMLGLGVIAPNLTDIRRDFDVSYAEISWGVSAFALARLVMNLPAGYAAGRLPRIPLLLAGTACVLVGSVVAAMSDGLPMFLAARAASGLGSSICTTVGLTIVLDTAAPDRRGKASGLFHSAIGGGAFFGPGFGGLLAVAGDWRLALFGAAGAAAISLVMLLIVIRGSQYKAAAKAPAPVATSPEPARASIGGMLALASAAYVAAFAIFFIRGSVQQTLVPLMGREEIGLSAPVLSTLLMASAGFTSLVGPYVGGLSDRYGASRLLVPGMAMLCLGTLVLTLSSTPALFIVGMAVCSIAGAVNSIPSSVIVDSVGASQRSLAIGVYRMVGDSALTASPFLCGWLTDVSGFRAAGMLSAAVAAGALLYGALRSRQAMRAARYSVAAGTSSLR